MFQRNFITNEILVCDVEKRIVFIHLIAGEEFIKFQKLVKITNCGVPAMFI